MSCNDKNCCNNRRPPIEDYYSKQPSYYSDGLRRAGHWVDPPTQFAQAPSEIADDVDLLEQRVKALAADVELLTEAAAAAGEFFKATIERGDGQDKAILEIKAQLDRLTKKIEGDGLLKDLRVLANQYIPDVFPNQKAIPMPEYNPTPGFRPVNPDCLFNTPNCECLKAFKSIGLTD